MKNKYDLVLFDLDGTLTDPGSGLMKSFYYALEKMGVTSVAIPLSSHKSVYNACSVFGIQPITFEMEKDEYGVENHIEFFDILFVRLPKLLYRFVKVIYF